MIVHAPVLQKEVLYYLDPKPDENFIDCTIGEAGHSLAILEKIKPNGKILGIDRDPEQVKNLASRILDLELRKRIVLVCDNFINLKEIIKKEKFGPVSGILFDLGMSSWHLEESGRGFSFLRDEPLYMRYDSNTSGVQEIVNHWPQDEIERILKEYGEERFAGRIAGKIIEARKAMSIETTFQLVEIIKKATPIWYHRRKIHPATRTFQALRIAVNDELKNLEKVLPQTLEILKSKGRLAVISFHSLEDRITKHFLKIQNKNNLIKILTKKPIRPMKEEIIKNPRSRSAKLRAIIKI